ncbi:photosystem I assembly protein Ycf3 [Gimesia panareensis]|uniref:Photosystem I assembly protein Ycf3 n=1 Tax=Gimesia panareensis TaxID=2527978 RepID=A0A517Q3B7_9PLAN|nr:tetratricopeptide repeat protein [Gimesia panareensis]QDT26114.1 photosystem I assembly protein Ycf3 [Gimesia panareensis]
MRNSTTWSLVILSGMATLFSAGCSHTNKMAGMNLPLEESPQMIMARTAEEKGQFVKAEQTYRVMLQRNPKNVTALHRMGIVCSKMGRHDMATRNLMEAVKLQPDNPKLLTDLGYALYLQNDLPAAEIALEEAIKRDTSSKRSFNNLSLVLGHQGRMDEAYQVARSVLSAEEAHANIGYICLQRGMLDDATRHYNQALEINPELDSVKEAIVQIAQLQKKQMQQAQSQEEVMVAESAPAEEVEAVVTEATPAEEPEFRVITDAETEVINPEMIPANETPVAQISAVQELPIQGFEPPLNISNDDYIPSGNDAFFETVESAQSVTNVRSAE